MYEVMKLNSIVRRDVDTVHTCNEWAKHLRPELRKDTEEPVPLSRTFQHPES